MKHVYLFVLLLLVFSSSCTSLRVMRVSPADSTMIDRYLYGSAIQKLDSELASVELGYYDNDRRYLVFDISITNNSNEAFDFDPATIHLLPHNGMPSVPAIDPEVQVLSMDLKTANRDRTARVLGGVALAASVVSVVTDAAPSPVADQLTFGEAFAIDMAAQVPYILLDLTTPRVAANDMVPSSPISRVFWMDVAMRITTIRPGETALGKIAFPRTDKTPGFDIVVPVGTQTLHFPFQQQIMRQGQR